MDILRPPTLADQQNITRQRVKGITDRGRLCKELRNAVPSHLKKRKNRRAVIKTVSEVSGYGGMQSLNLLRTLVARLGRVHG